MVERVTLWCCERGRDGCEVEISVQAVLNAQGRKEGAIP